MQHSYHSGTIKSLYAHSGNCCAFPGCGQELVCGEDANISEICHIYGLNPNSARYVKGFDEDYLNSEQNLILLCPTHHTMIDAKGNESMYSVQALLEMKANHEAYVKANISGKIENINNVYIYEYSKVKRKLSEKYAIDYKKKEIAEIGAQFSHQSQNVRTVMMKILDVMHGNQDYLKFYESGQINMMQVLSELYIDIWTLAQILQYLSTLGLVEEFNFQSDNINSYLDDGYGNLVNVSNNYIYKIQQGCWKVTTKGMVLDAIYSNQSYL